MSLKDALKKEAKGIAKAYVNSCKNKIGSETAFFCSNITDKIYAEKINPLICSTVMLEERDKELVNEVFDFIRKINPDRFKKYKDKTERIKDFKCLPYEQQNENKEYIFYTYTKDYKNILKVIPSHSYYNNSLGVSGTVMIIKIYGSNRKAIAKKIDKIIENYSSGLRPERSNGNKKNHKNMVVQILSESGHFVFNRILTKNKEDIIMDEDKKKTLFSLLDAWRTDNEWYKNNGMIHKTGVLLYGEPGTGKTSLAKAIASQYCDRDGCLFSLSCSNSNQLSNAFEEIISDRENYEGVFVVLIEDIDMLFPNGNRENEVSEDQLKAQHLLFQMLDGTSSITDTIYIATTNYIDKLDSALIREGRFDIKLKMSHFNEEEALKQVKQLGYDKDLLDSFELTYPVSPVKVQSKVLECRANSYFVENPLK